MGAVQHIFEWCDVYGAVAPTTGARFCLALACLNAETFQRCIDACAAACSDSLNILLPGHSGAPTARPLIWPATGRCLWVPPYGPELHPSARVWRDLQDQLAGTIFPELPTLQDAVEVLLRADEAATLQPLTGDPSLVEAIHALCL